MPVSLQDLVKGIDITGVNPATAGNFNTLVDNGTVAADKGLNIVTTDLAQDQPDTPDANATPKWQTATWIRLPFLTSIGQFKSTDSPRTYHWNNNIAADALLLKWMQVDVDLSTVNAAVAAAQNTANQALNTANNANTNAGAANANANNAVIAANAATTTANNSATTANAAQASANNALAVANNPKQPNAALLPGTAGQKLRTKYDGTAAEWYSERFTYSKVTEQYANNSTPNANGFPGLQGENVRNLNNVEFDPSGNITLTLNVVTVKTTGYYYLKAKAMIVTATGVNVIKKNAALSIIGMPAGVAALSNDSSYAEAEGVLFLNANTDQVQVSSILSLNTALGLGIAANVGQVEKYTVLEMWLIS